MATRVVVTGAAGQIGYAILFRIASGQLLGPDEKVELRLLEIPDAVKAAEGTALELFDCAFPLLQRHRDLRRPQQGLRRRQRRAARSARARARRAWSAPTCSRPTARSSSRRARRSTPTPPTTCEILVVGNPANTNALIAMSNAPDIPAERFTRDDAPGREPRGRPARPEARRRRRRRPGPRRLGQPLADDVPRPVQREGQRSSAPSTRSTWTGTRTSTSRASASAAPRSSRRAARRRPRRPPTRRSTTCATGSLGADGLRSMAVPLGRPVRRRGGADVLVPGALSAAASYEIVEGLEVGDFAQAKIDATVERAQGGARRGARSWAWSNR